MERVPITIMGYKCERCPHQWVPKASIRPRVCPRCKSAYWDIPRREKKAIESK